MSAVRVSWMGANERSIYTGNFSFWVGKKRDRKVLAPVLRNKVPSDTTRETSMIRVDTVSRETLVSCNKFH